MIVMKNANHAPADSLNHAHQTGELVAEAGVYFCDIGEKQTFAKGDTFPACPVHGNKTIWHHAKHEHKTGDVIEESGEYFCTTGEHLNLVKGELFPVCPTLGEVTIWQHAV